MWAPPLVHSAVVSCQAAVFSVLEAGRSLGSAVPSGHCQLAATRRVPYAVVPALDVPCRASGRLRIRASVGPGGRPGPGALHGLQTLLVLGSTLLCEPSKGHSFLGLSVLLCKRGIGMALTS